MEYKTVCSLFSDGEMYEISGEDFGSFHLNK